MASNSKFNFADIKNSAATVAAEGQIVNGFGQMKTDGVGEQAPQPTPTRTETNAPQQETEDVKGIQAYIPMSVYERLMMRKLRNKETLGSMFVQAIKYWLDATEGK